MKAEEHLSPMDAPQAGEPMALLDIPVEDSDEEGNLPTRRAMNSTAYRIFKLLQWLMETPLSVEALNVRFREEPYIGKPVSSDSIWLYINTLKELGCRIRRPSPRNGFCYEMLSHPFGLTLDECQLETLAQVKAQAQRQFTPQDMLVLDSLLKKVVTYSTCENPAQVIEQLFAQSRSFDYGDSQAQLASLEGWIVQGQLLRLGYYSPRHGEEQFYFLPMALFYEQGVVYVRGERADFDAPSSLRADRILSLEPVDDPDMAVALQVRTEVKTEVVLHLLANGPDDFSGFQLGENQGVYDECIKWKADQGCHEVRLQVRDLFYLKQRLLACGVPFRILAPEGFRLEVAKTLSAMLRFYQSEGA